MKRKWMKTLAVTLAVVCMAGCGEKDAAGQLSEGVMAKEAEYGQNPEERGAAETKAVPQGRQDKSAAALNGELFDGRSIQIGKGSCGRYNIIQNHSLRLLQGIIVRARMAHRFRHGAGSA